jgi:hypothetical protein
LLLLSVLLLLVWEVELEDGCLLVEVEEELEKTWLSTSKLLAGSS